MRFINNIRLSVLSRIILKIKIFFHRRLSFNSAAGRQPLSAWLIHQPVNCYFRCLWTISESTSKNFGSSLALISFMSCLWWGNVSMSGWCGALSYRKIRSCCSFIYCRSYAVAIGNVPPGRGLIAKFCPEGTSENSPTIYCRERIFTTNQFKSRRDGWFFLIRPCGTQKNDVTLVPGDIYF